MAKRSPIKNTLVPYSAGYAILTPLDENAKPMLDRAVMTPTNYLTSTTFSENTTYEEIETGSGQNDSQPSGRSATITLTLSAYSPIFHAAASGKLEYLPDKTLTNKVFEHILPEVTGEADMVTYTFGTETTQKAIPAANSEGVYRFIIRDKNGNYLTKRDTAMLGTYVYDPDTKTLTFSKDYAGERLEISYDYEETNAVVYRANPILKANKFLLETYGITQDVFSNKTYKVKRSLTRCQVSGDLPEMPTQGSRSTSITYTFDSISVPDGVVPWENTWTEYIPEELQGAVGDNVVNGYDDDFTTTPTPGGADTEI